MIERRRIGNGGRFFVLDFCFFEQTAPSSYSTPFRSNTSTNVNKPNGQRRRSNSCVQPRPAQNRVSLAGVSNWNRRTLFCLFLFPFVLAYLKSPPSLSVKLIVIDYMTTVGNDVWRLTEHWNKRHDRTTHIVFILKCTWQFCRQSPLFWSFSAPRCSRPPLVLFHLSVQIIDGLRTTLLLRAPSICVLNELKLVRNEFRVNQA